MLLKFSGMGCSRIWIQNSGHSSLRWPVGDNKAHGQSLSDKYLEYRVIHAEPISAVQFRLILTDEIDEARTRCELVTASVGLEMICGTARVDLVKHGPDVGQGKLVTGLEESEDSREVASFGGDQI